MGLAAIGWFTSFFRRFGVEHNRRATKSLRR